LDDGSKVLHNIVVGKPVEEITHGLSAPLPMSEALGSMAAVAPIPPVDAVFTAVKRVIQIGTIAWGAVTMNPVLVAAGVKAIAHDKAVEILEKGIERTLIDRGPAKAPDGRGGLPHPDPTPHPDPVTHPVPIEFRRPPSDGWSPRGRPQPQQPAPYPPPRSPRRRNPGAGPTRGGPAPRG
jgi:hypothetical protein